MIFSCFFCLDQGDHAPTTKKMVRYHRGGGTGQHVAAWVRWLSERYIFLAICHETQVDLFV